MRKTTTIFILSILLLASSAYAESEYPLLDELYTLSEDQIDIGLVSLMLAKEVYPDLDIQAYSKKIDDLANVVKALTTYSKDPEFRIRAMNTFLYKHYKLQYDFTDPYLKNLKNRYLNGILDTKKGSCVTMPLLYLAIAQRLGYPVYFVPTPFHYFLRYEDPRLKLRNIEATDGGGYSPDSAYKRNLEITDKSIKNGTYLKTMTNRELMGDLIAQNGIYWGQQGYVPRAIEYLEVAAKLYPTRAEIYDNLNKGYLFLSKRTRGVSSDTLRAKAQAAAQKAEDLGIVRLSEKNQQDYIKHVNQKSLGVK